MKTKTNSLQKTKRLTIVALFCALSFVVSAVLPIKVPPFLTLDFKDSVSAICGMFFGPVSGLFCAIAVPFIEFLTTSTTGVYGLIMNLLSSITFVGVSTLIYKYKKTIWGAVIGLSTAAVSTVAVMLVANLLITPYYMGVTMGDVLALIPKLLFPFNLVKTVLNAGITMLLYKPISKVLKRMRITKTAEEKKELTAEEKANLRMRSLVVTVLSIFVVIVALWVVFFVFKGEFTSI